MAVFNVAGYFKEGDANHLECNASPEFGLYGIFRRENLVSCHGQGCDP